MRHSNGPSSAHRVGSHVEPPLLHSISTQAAIALTHMLTCMIVYVHVHTIHCCQYSMPTHVRRTVHACAHIPRHIVVAGRRIGCAITDRGRNVGGSNN